MKVFLGLGCLAIAACAPVAPLPEPSGPCAVTETVRGRYIGVKFRESMRAELQRDTNARIARVVRPDDVVTMDLRQDRLDILLDDGNQIEGLRCG
jgi:hypothetical protein